MAGRGPRKRTRGEIEQLPSGALRVRVYAGQDPLSGKRHYLSQTVPAGPGAAKVAEQVRTKFLNQVDERRNPITKATMNDLFDQWLAVAELQPSTRVGYESKLNTHIRPAIGGIQVARLDVQTLEALYAALRRCRERCSGRVRTQHHARGKHDCDERCVVHECRPLSPATVRQMHSMIQAALGRAVRWQWIAVNVAERAVAPTAPAPNPQPPTAAEAARILAEAWKDPYWGTLVWLAMATGMRRGEICALRWRHVDLDQRVLIVRASIGQVERHTWEKDTKTHQQRRIALDDHSVGVLRAHLDRCTADAAAVDVELGPDAFVFSRDPDGKTWLLPDSVGSRYAYMCKRIGIRSHLHQLRHYSATELISAGVDVRTVAGRLGHGGGGITTLRVYSAWRSEIDQRAAASVGARLPAPPVQRADARLDGSDPSLDEAEDASPYRRIAADLRAAIRIGALKSGDALPPLTELAARYNVAVGTAHRAVALLTEEALVVAARGQRTRVA